MCFRKAAVSASVPAFLIVPGKWEIANVLTQSAAPLQRYQCKPVRTFTISAIEAGRFQDTRYISTHHSSTNDFIEGVVSRKSSFCN